jgi:tRNA 2-thiouridine synthesizing protein B
MLHLIAETSLSQAVVERIVAGDDVVLQGGSVWAALLGHEDNSKLQQLIGLPCRVYALQDLLVANGIAGQKLLLGVVAVDYAELVELTVKNPVIHTWS